MAGSGQRARDQNAGGQKIDDHSFWMNGKEAGSPMPMKTGMKGVSSTEGAGSLPRYEDTNERIVDAQKAGVGKIKGHQGKLPQFRN